MPSFDRFTHNLKFADQDQLLADLVRSAGLKKTDLDAISDQAQKLVERIRAEAKPSLMEYFLAEYGLSTREGIALMCLAEAMLRVPDAETIDALIEDKISPSNWGRHLGTSSSSLVNASTWALMLTGRVLDDEKPGMAGVLHGAIKRLGEPVIRLAVAQAMKEMGRQFVLGETIQTALARAEELEKKGYTYSYDMLGEAAMTATDARRYAASYAHAIEAIKKAAKGPDIRTNPGISVKLSALHPRYEVAQTKRMLDELVPVVLSLAIKAKNANIGFNIDAEEQDRLVISLEVIEKVLSSPELSGWDGFGVVVQAYGKRANAVIDWLYQTAVRLDRRTMVRLVKGAYWDSEMKLAQMGGLDDFSLFTSKAATDVSYIANGKKLLDYSDRIYPQFATHNAHSVATIQKLAGNRPYEFQRLHGMGERLHDIVLKDGSGRCRIYAPVGAHRDLLAYLVRRLLENGANSSFVHQIVDETVAAEHIARDPFAMLKKADPPRGLKMPSDLFAPKRLNSVGFDLTDADTLERIEKARSAARMPDAMPLIASKGLTRTTGPVRSIINPANGKVIAKAHEADEKITQTAINAARIWDAPVAERAAVLNRAAELYEENFGLIFATLAQEAGKTLADAVGELREAVDFLRYYAVEATEKTKKKTLCPRGIVSAISPWNFPLAIFTGQIAAALAAGNAVLAKPAEATPLIASIATGLLHQAGVPPSALQLLPGEGKTVGTAITSHPAIAGVVFTGSTATAKIINKNMAAHLAPGTPLIAETGGINAMMVDSTALPEQAVRDVVASAFQSAGQRCSALRCLYVQEEIAPHLTEMLKGAMDELSLGDPYYLSTDIGPVIDKNAYDAINAYVKKAEAENRLLHRLEAPKSGWFIAPSLIAVDEIDDIEREIFGPVLHVAIFKNNEADKVIKAVNKTGYGLTFGLHTRIDDRVEAVERNINVGNLYVNRNQIGAIVGSQPFGGEGLSGTGPKAGGPFYLPRFFKPEPALKPPADKKATGFDEQCNIAELTKAIKATKANHQRQKLKQLSLPGPTGEANTLSLYARGPIICSGPGKAMVKKQIAAVKALGGTAIGLDGTITPEALQALGGIDGVIWWGEAEEKTKAYAKALSEREGPIVPLITQMPDQGHVAHERHLCVDTTASGGNADLLAG